MSGSEVTTGLNFPVAREFFRREGWGVEAWLATRGQISSLLSKVGIDNRLHYDVDDVGTARR